MSSSISRRQLFKLRASDLGNLAGQVRQSAGDEEIDGQDALPPFIRPPGALQNEAAFLASCERCHACVDACPYDDVIQTFGPSHGQREGAPYLIPDNHPCRWCSDTPCVSACPTEALKSLDSNDDGEMKLMPIAKAVINLDTCLNNQGILCDTCALMCPPHVKAIKMINRKPQLDPDQCTGCGMCAYYCESEPNSICIEALT